MPIQGYTPNLNLPKISPGSTDNWDVWYNQSLDALDPPSLIYQITAAQDIAAGNVAVIKDDGAGAKKAYLAASGTYTFGDPLGVVNQTASAGNPTRLTLEGRAQNNSWSFGTAHKFAYLSASGAVTTAQTATKIGYVISASSIFFQPGGSGGSSISITGANGIQNTGSASNVILSPVYGSTVNTVCQGNDARLHSQNTDGGTNAASFEINYTANSARLQTTGLTAMRDYTFPDATTKLVGESASAAITVQHWFSPTSAKAPFILGANAQGQLVTGLNADMLDGQHSSAFATSGHDHTGTYEPANANIQSHISSTSNPHSVSAAQVGNATAQWNADKIRGAAVSSTAPSDGQVLKYVAANSQYEPSTSGGSSQAATGGGLGGLVIRSNAANPAYQMDISADFADLWDGTQWKSFRAISLTADITVAGANGRDAGSEASSTWYYIWLIGKTDGTVAGLFSTSSTAPTMPSGYTYKRCVGAIYNDASSNFWRILQIHDRVYTTHDFPSGLYLSSGGSTTYALVTPNVPVIALEACIIAGTSTAGSYVYFSVDGVNGYCAPYGGGPVYMLSAPFVIPLTSAQKHYYKVSTGSCNMYLVGWRIKI
ncbi:MAG: hypothetical protein HZB29_13920 [Nitrospinae bacterium]|nr:hypothetical protein [Nitrospinota bacterium]